MASVSANSRQHAVAQTLGLMIVEVAFILQAQQQQLERAEAAYHRSTARLREMQEQLHRHGGADDADMDGSRLLELLRDDVARLRHQVMQSCT